MNNDGGRQVARFLAKWQGLLQWWKDHDPMTICVGNIDLPIRSHCNASWQHEGLGIGTILAKGSLEAPIGIEGEYPIVLWIGSIDDTTRAVYSHVRLVDD